MPHDNIRIGNYQVLPDMPPEQFAALKADIAERGVVTPIDVDEHGVVLDGHHRYRAWTELQKNEPIPTIVRSGLSETEKRAFARKNNILRRHLSREEVRSLIAQQLKETPDWADRRVARELGVDHKTVGTVRDGLVAGGEIPHLEKLEGADGKKQAAGKRQRREKTNKNDDWNEVFREAFVSFGGQVIPREQLPNDMKLAFFDAGISPENVFVMSDEPFRGPDEGLSEDQIRQWRVYMLHLARGGLCLEGVLHSVEYMRRTGWDDPSQWYSEEGDKYRRRLGFNVMPDSAKTEWQNILAEYRSTPIADIEAEIERACEVKQ